MPLVKCPRCELNYMQAGEKYCAVCKREMRGDEENDSADICTNCGERPVVPGEEFCAICLKEMTRTEGYTTPATSDEPEVADESALDMPSASEMDEINIGIEDEDNIPEGEYKVIKHELGDDDEFASVSLNEMAEDEDKDDDEDEDDGK